jgi:hypothetical protein
MLRPECGRRPIEKARDRFSRRGLCYSCDDGNMPVICPTYQTFPVTANPDPADERSRSRLPAGSIKA